MSLFASTSYPVAHLKGTHRNYQKFILITHGRTGSTFLMSLLSSHEDIVAFAEVMHSKHVWFGYDGYPDLHSKSLLGYRNDNVTDFLDTMIFRSYADNISAVGLKLFYNEPADNLSTVLNYLNRLDLKVIFLKRANLLKSFISAKIAQKNNVWRIKDESAQNRLVDIHVDINECISYFKRVVRNYDRYERIFHNKSKIEVWYEDLINNTPKVAADVQNFLGARIMSLRSDMKKQNNRRLEDVISNYDEIWIKLKDTKWANFLYDS